MKFFIEKIEYIITCKFLVKNPYKNWMFIIFIVLLSIINITSSHIIYPKIKKIEKLTKEIEELNIEYTDLLGKVDIKKNIDKIFK